MRLLTGSKAHLAMHNCSYFLSDHLEWDESSGPAAKTGSEVHAAIDAILRGEECPTISHMALRILDRWLSWYKNNGVERQSEKAFAYHPKSDWARPLTMAHPRDYSGVYDGEIGLTVDAFTPRMGDIDGEFIHVIDWKTGRPVAKAAVNGQLAVAACALAALHKVDRVKVQLVYLSEDGVDDSDSAWLGPLDFAITRHKLMKAMKPGEPKPGEHCYRQFCPARFSCTQTTAYRPNYRLAELKAEAAKKASTP